MIINKSLFSKRIGFCYDMADRIYQELKTKIQETKSEIFWPLINFFKQK
jgi:hypothetical protein